MKNNKLTELMSLLGKKAIKSLRLYLRSDYCIAVKQKKMIIELFEFLIVHHPNYTKLTLTKSEIFNQLFPAVVYSGNKMDKLMASLTKVIKHFIVIEHAIKGFGKIEQELVLAKFFHKNSQEKSFHSTIDQIKKQQRAVSKRNKRFYFQQFQIEETITDQLSLHNNRNSDLNLPSTLKKFDDYYLITKLEYGCWALAQHKAVLFECEESLVMLDKSLKSISQERIQNNYYLNLYSHSYQLLRGHSDHWKWQQFDGLLREFGGQLSDHQLKAFQSISRSVLNSGYNKGEEEGQFVFEIYKEHLKLGYLYYEGRVNPSTIRNMVLYGLKAKSFSWVKKFIEDHKTKIYGTNKPDDVYHYNLAEYFFATKKYTKAMTLVNNFGEDAYYKIGSKRLELKILFNQQHDLLEKKIAAFKVFLHRLYKKNLPISQFDRNNNFINLLKQINSPSVYKNQEKISKLLRKVSTSKALYDRDWLKEKIEVLK